VQYW
jgi:hypothetical protein